MADFLRFEFVGTLFVTLGLCECHVNLAPGMGTSDPSAVIDLPA